MLGVVAVVMFWFLCVESLKNAYLKCHARRMRFRASIPNEISELKRLEIIHAFNVIKSRVSLRAKDRL